MKYRMTKTIAFLNTMVGVVALSLGLLVVIGGVIYGSQTNIGSQFMLTIVAWGIGIMIGGIAILAYSQLLQLAVNVANDVHQLATVQQR